MISELSFLIAAISLAWFASALFDYSEFVYLWQLKEYRRDKFRDFLSTKKGRSYWYSYPFFSRSVLALFVFFIPINSTPFALGVLLGFLIFDVVVQWFRYKKGETHRPAITPKTIVLVVLSIATEALLNIWLWDISSVFLLCIIRFFIATALVMLFSAPTEYIKTILIRQATKKIARLDSTLTVIGVTGSYGKTTVKEFLAHVLEDSFEVVKTPMHVNTEIGVAKFILKTNFKNQKIFIVEMGAYRKGEIARIADMVHPKMGILTSINEQHLSLFGSIEQTQAAKYELLRRIPKDGLAITNSDNAYCRAFLHELACQVEAFGVEEEFHPTLLVHEATEGKNGVAVTYTFAGKTETDVLPLHGLHTAINIAPCVLVAHHLGMSMERIHARLSSLPQRDQSLEVRTFGSATIIDDSYNSNPAGFKAALDFMSTFPASRRRIVVTRGMLELGDKSSELHEEIAGHIAFIADELIMVEDHEVEAIKRGLVSEKYQVTLRLVTRGEELKTFFEKEQDTTDVILIENRLPSTLYAWLRAHSEASRA